MLSFEQEKWINHLPDDNKIEIHPYDPAVPEIFEKIKGRICGSLGEDIKVHHRGSTSLGISGQGELDIYIPVPPLCFDALLVRLESLFGKPGSVYQKRRARFVDYTHGEKAEVFLINEESDDWLNCLKFEEYLKRNPDALAAYENLKKSGNGFSTRSYYRIKTEFINDIFERIKFDGQKKYG